MVNIRNLKLYALDTNKEFDLTNHNQFLHSIDGLGNTKILSTTASPLGTKFITKETKNLLPITGTISFLNYTKYEEFNEFVVKNNQNLELRYSFPYKNTTLTLKAKVFVQTFSKSEIGNDNRLSSKLKLLRMSNWYSPVDNFLTHTMELVTSKFYPYKYPYSYNIKNPHYTKKDYIVDTLYAQYVNIELSPTVALPHIIFRSKTTNKIVAEFKTDEDITQGLSDIVSFNLISTPWNRDFYALLGNGNKISLKNKISFDDNITHFIRLKPDSYTIEADDLKPTTAAGIKLDLMKFTFIEERSF